METPTNILILFFFLLILISIIGLSLSGARVEIRTLKARLDRRDALDVSSMYIEVKKPERSGLDAWAEAISVKELKSRLSGKDKEIEALGHTITLKDETIKHLNGDIAKLKFDYAAEVTGRNDVTPISDAEKSALLYGEWLYDGEPDTSGEPGIKSDGRCSDPDCSKCYSELNAESPNLDEEVDG